MSGKDINFEDKKIKKGDFYENKKAFKIDDIVLIKYQFIKKKYIAQISHLNILLDIMTMMILDLYP